MLDALGPLMDHRFDREATLHELVAEMLRHSDGLVLDTSGLAPNHHTTGHRQPGAPDFLVFENRRMVALELKSRVGKVSNQQILWGKKWTAQGGVYVVCRSLQDAHDAVHGRPPDIGDDDLRWEYSRKHLTELQEVDK
ncbi:MAG: hypothetical protein OXI18_11755 [bacterium]|nr:hypothetical protein [bacterium]